VLSLPALRNLILQSYPIAASSSLYFWQAAQGGGNDMYLVQDGDAKYFLRVYLHGFNEIALNAQIALINDLAELGLPIPRIMPCLDGSFIQPIHAPEGLRYAILTTFAEGISPGRAITEAHSLRYGQVLAQMHRTADQLSNHYDLPMHDANYLIDEPRAVLQVGLNADDDWQRIRTLLTSLPTTPPTYGLCHGDAHKSNFLYTATGDLTLIDFDCVGYGWRAYDLAVFRWSTARPARMGGLEPDRVEAVWNSFLTGYRAEYTLDQTTLDAVPVFVLARHLWWMAIDVAKIRDGKIGGGWLNADWWTFQRGILDDLRQLPTSAG
jgi:Ser/Thr protein kinase RdoA (MazF antagonist)